MNPSSHISHPHAFRSAAASRFLVSAVVTGLAAAGLLIASSPARAADAESWFKHMGWGGIEGSGRQQTENRAVSGFQAVALRGSMNLVLRQGTREGIELKGDDNILPLIDTSVVDRNGVPTLEIGTRPGSGYSSRTPIVATIDLKTLTALTISGSGEVVCDALKTPQLRIAVSGSGNLRLERLETEELTSKVSGSGDLQFSGHVGRAVYSVSGSGDIDAKSLDADDVSISVAGSGDATVNARKTLTVSIAGNGNVSYRGDPSVKTSVAGHGSIKKL